MSGHLLHLTIKNVCHNNKHIPSSKENSLRIAAELQLQANMIGLSENTQSVKSVRKK